MKIKAAVLKKMIDHAKKTVDAKSSMPVLAHVRLEAILDVLQLDATDLAAHLTLCAPCDGELPALCVNLKHLGEVVAAKGKDKPDVSLTAEYRPAPDNRPCNAPVPKDLVARAMKTWKDGGGEGKVAAPCNSNYKHEGLHQVSTTVGCDKLEWEGATPARDPLPDDVFLLVEVGARKFTLPCLRDSDFPKLPVTPTGEALVYEAKALASALDFVLPAISTDITRSHLGYVVFDRTCIIAVDGHRLHMDNGPWPDVGTSLVGVALRAGTALRALLDGAATSNVSMIVECLTTTQGVRSGSKTTEEIVPAGGNTIWFCGLKDGISASLIARWQEFMPPPFEQVIPTLVSADVRVVVASAALAEACAFAGKLSHAGNVKFTVNGALCVSSDDGDGRGCQEEVAAEIAWLGEHRGLVFAAQGRYFMEALTGMGASTTITTVKMSTTVNGEVEGLNPLRLDSGNRLAVVMPCRL